MNPKRSNKLLPRTAMVAITALAVVAVGGYAGASTVSRPAATKATVTVKVSKTKLGNTLVNSKGRTLYLFKKDSGTTSACTGACATAWPPLTVTGKPSVGHGAKASLIGTVARSDGTRQVTYNGHPLYLFQGDQKAGATNGEGVTAFGASWFALSPAGKQLAPRASGSGATTTTASSRY